MGKNQSDPVLWGSDGKPLSLEGAMLAPNALNVAQVYQNTGRLYSHRYDEAIRDAPENAKAMRRDTFYLSLIQERTAPTINLEWQVEVDNEDDPIQKLDADICNRGWREIPDKPGLMTWLSQAGVWFGRAGQQGVWDKKDSDFWNWVHHEPVHGDSIQFQWDNTPVILVSNYTAQKVRAVDPDAVISSTDRGAWGLRLYKPEYRRRFAIHKHCREAADYYDGEMSGGVHGVGLRSWAYWNDFVRRDTLAAMLGFVSATGMMDLMCFNFPAGDVEAENRAKANAKKISGKIVLICPRDPAKDWPAIEQFPMNTNGVETMKALIEDTSDRYTRELFVGQTMSNGGGGPGGLEGDGRAELAGDTKFQLCKTDALRLGETLTRDWLIPFRDYNRPGSKTPMRMVPVLQDPKQREKAQNVTVAVSSGIEIEEDEARTVLGFKKPRDGKKTIGKKEEGAGGMPPGMGPDGNPKPPGAGGRATAPKQPSKATDFFDRLDVLEGLVTRYGYDRGLTLFRAAQPPFPGGQFNEQTHRWEKPGEQNPQGGRATTSQPPDHFAGDDHEVELKPEIKQAILASLEHDLPDEVKSDPGLLDKAKDAALTVAARAYMWAVNATHSKAMAYLADAMEAIFDTPADLMKLGYNPANSSGTEQGRAGVKDAVRDNMTAELGVGISGHLTAKIASTVLVRAAYWIKSRFKKKPEGTATYEGGDEPDGYGEWAELVSAVLARTQAAMGVEGKVPDAEQIEKNLRVLVKSHEDRFTGYEAVHAPAGGVTVQGTFYPGGKFIPKDVVAKASAAEKKAMKGEAGSGGSGPKAGKSNKPGSDRATTPASVKGNRERASKRQPDKAVRGVGQIVDVARSRRIRAAHKREKELADAIGGYNLLDSEPADVAYVPEVGGNGVRTGRPLMLDQRTLRQFMAKRAKMVERMIDPKTDSAVKEGIRRVLEEMQPLTFFEVKTLLTSQKNEVRINPAALKAKRDWEEKYHAKFAVVIVDDRKGQKHSGHRVYVQRGDQSVDKVHKLSDSRKAESMAAVLKLASE